LGWKEKIDFDVGIERTVKWYLSNQELFLDNKDTQKATPWK